MAVAVALLESISRVFSDNMSSVVEVVVSVM